MAYSEHCQTFTMETFAKKLRSTLFSLSCKIFFQNKFPKKSALKKFLIFSQKKAFLIFSQKLSCTFWLQSPKCFPKKPALNFFIYIFFQKKPLIFWNQKSLKKSLYFRKWNFVILLEVTSQDQKFFIIFPIKTQNFLN